MLKLVERGAVDFKSPPIKLSLPGEGAPTSISPDVQVLRVGKFNHPKYGEFEITTKVLSEMKANFDDRVRGVDVAFDYFHDSDKEASGWPTELFLKEDGQELWAKVDWTAQARRKLAEREIRYFSPDFAFQWEDPETGITYQNVLFGGGLTNRPFVKDMAAIVASEAKGKKLMNEKELKELQATVLKLSEDQSSMKAENEAMKKKLAEYDEAAKKVVPPAPADAGESDEGEETLDSVKKKLADVMAMNEKLMGEKKKLEEAKAMSEKEASFTVLLTEGKACVAQKDAFLKGDMAEFVKLSQPVNLAPNGTTTGGTDKGDRDDKILKLAEEKVKANPKLSLVDAISMSVREVK